MYCNLGAGSGGRDAARKILKSYVAKGAILCIGPGKTLQKMSCLLDVTSSPVKLSPLETSQSVNLNVIVICEQILMTELHLILQQVEFRHSTENPVTDVN